MALNNSFKQLNTLTQDKTSKSYVEGCVLLFKIKMFLIKSLKRNYSQNTETKKKICIVGSGPGGFYAAQYILKHLPNSFVDIIEKLPVPYGLVRYVLIRISYMYVLWFWTC